MLPPLEYLAWATERYPSLRFDLATSGLAEAPLSLLGDLPHLDARGADRRFAAAVAGRYGLSPDEVTPALGTSGALWLVYAGCFSRGDTILVERPAYEPVVRVAEGAGLRVERFDRRREDGWRVEPARVLGALSPATKGVVLTDLHNPSGTPLDDTLTRELAAHLAARGVLLVVDEVYRELYAPGTTARSLGPNVVVTSSLTKAFGLGALRAGFVLSEPELAPRLRGAALHAVGVLPTATFALATAAMAALPAFEARRAELQADKRELIDAWLAARGDVLSWVPPHEGSLFGFVRDARGGDLRGMLERGLARDGVLSAPGSFFDGYDDSFRLAWSGARETLVESLALLGRALELDG